MQIEKNKPIKDPKYLEYIRTKDCLLGHGGPVEAHHLLRTGEHGMGQKSGDNWAVPLCKMHHNQLHANGNEVRFFFMYGKDHEEILDWCRHSYKRFKSGRVPLF